MPVYTLIASLLVFAALASGAPQQNAGTNRSKPEIRGVVLESGTNQPVADAEIVLFVREPGPARINGGWTVDARRGRTNYAGAFTLSLDKPGSYRLAAAKPDYFPAAAGLSAGFTEVTVTDEHPMAETKLFLARQGRITGRVIDEETGRPMTKLRLILLRRDSRGGFPPDGPDTTTDAWGQFTAPGLAPGEYAVEIRPQTAPEKRVLTQFRDEDRNAVERDIEHTYWPGGQGIEAVLPVTVASGATVDIGKLSVRRVPYYRAHVRIPAETCAAEDEVQVTESVRTARGATVHRLAVVPCGRDLLVTGFAPGAYRLILAVKSRTWETRATASVPFSILDKSIEITASLLPGVNLEGVFIPAEGALAPDLSNSAVLLTPMDFVGFMNEIPRVSPSPDGKFRISGVRLVDHMVYVSGLGPGNYVKEIRYNGTAVTGDIISLGNGAMAHMLTIVVDDKSGAIVGAVMAGDQPVAEAVVVVRKWPPSSSSTHSGFAGAKADEAGRFRITGLAPGEYHVLAMRAIDPSTSDAGLENALSGARKVDVGPGGVQSLTLEITDVR